jgi:hypothetical protein
MMLWLAIPAADVHLVTINVIYNKASTLSFQHLIIIPGGSVG